MVLRSLGLLKRVVSRKWDATADACAGDRFARLANLHNVNEFGYDEFGLSPAYVRRVLPALCWLYRRYFRVVVRGVERVPAGRVLLVANHSGQLPFDGMMIAMALLLEAEPPRIVRSMVERWVPTLPYVSTFFTRCGQLVGTRANARRLLERSEALLVFPEGARGISKTFDHRYQLVDFGHGFMRLALETDTPIVPIGVVGAEEQAPAFYDAQAVARLLGAPAFPITPTFPWLGPAGLWPYPVRYRIVFGEPLHFEGDPNEEEALIAGKVERVRTAIRRLLDTELARRRHIFW